MSQVEDLARLRKRRGTTRGQVTRSLRKVKDALDDSSTDQIKLRQLETSLNEHKAELKSLDNEILEKMYDLDETEEACNEEASEASDIMENMVYYLICLEDVLKESQQDSDAEPGTMHRSVSEESVRSNESMSSKVSLSSRASSKVKSFVESQVSSQVSSGGSSNGSSHVKSKVQGSEALSQNHAVRVKLPKISLQKFSG